MSYGEIIGDEALLAPPCISYSRHAMPSVMHACHLLHRALRQLKGAESLCGHCPRKTVMPVQPSEASTMSQDNGQSSPCEHPPVICSIMLLGTGQVGSCSQTWQSPVNAPHACTGCEKAFKIAIVH